MLKIIVKKTNTLFIIIAKKIILFLTKWLKIDLVILAFKNIGVMNSGNLEKTGEKFVIDNLLPKKITASSPVLFDVGGNIGEYAIYLKNIFPTANIFSFEPNPKAFAVMKEKLAEFNNVACENIGLGPTVGSEKMFSYSKVENSAFGTLNKAALSDLYKMDDRIEEINFSINTIDNCCAQKNISQIDFLKIDTEGQELNVLKGAEQMIKNNKIKIIQFEFNNFNVYYRIFLKDFYGLLNNYNFYRAHRNGLIALGDYDTINEIFKFQNIIAISRAL